MQQTTDQDTHRQLKEATLFLAEYASTLMAVGAQTSRIQLNTVRMARSMDYHVSLLIFPKTISITCRTRSGTTLTHTSRRLRAYRSTSKLT